jgi:mannosyl-oligosaccharide glucosidase
MFALRRLSFALSAVALVALIAAPARGVPPLWSTYRPHALISARARVPHSPAFGVAYHDARAPHAVRHLASDDHGGAISSFSFTRHDALSFADHRIEDKGLNAIISSSFVNRRRGESQGGWEGDEEEAWTLRVSGAVIDPTKDTGKVSLVFYAAAGPEEVDETARSAINNGSSGPWGTVRISESQHLSTSGLAGDCVLDGHAPSVGGGYRVIVREPSLGGLGRGEDGTPSSSSRRRRRTRADLDRAAVDLSRFHVSAPRVDVEKSFLIDSLLKSKLIESSQARLQSSDESLEGVVTTLINEAEVGAPVVLVQRIVELPFQMDIVFVMRESRSDSQVSALVEELSSENLDTELSLRRSVFDSKFSRLFEFDRRGYGSRDTDFARTALANILGGIGYFYGSTIVSEGGGETSLRKPIGLLTSTPSRANFPRGFLWDEGFHQLLIQRWDPVLSRACLTSWLGLMDSSGWIPREQVLGVEARARFPNHVKDLMIQDPTVANPPTILMPLRVFAIADAAANVSDEKNDEYNKEGRCAADAAKSCASPSSSSLSQRVEDNTVAKLFWLDSLDKAVTNFMWLRETQAGDSDGSFRWRGRTPKLLSPEGYPLTLASGLDDYPRSSVPRDNERHLDLHCWVAWAAGAIAELHRAAGRPAKKFDDMREHLVASLDGYHKQVIGKDGKTGRGSSPELLCDFDGQVSVCHDGYVVVLPLLLGLLENDSPRVGAILDLLESPRALRSPAGVRSLSIASPFYRKGDDYWTGSVWMPFNYLTMAALHSKYGAQDGPYRERAAALYASLKSDILSNAQRVFEQTGHLWENYSPDDGSGKSGRQFTGWSALVVLIYADIYDGVL